jgi:hypothetical protein
MSDHTIDKPVVPIFHTATDTQFVNIVKQEIEEVNFRVVSLVDK